MSEALRVSFKSQVAKSLHLKMRDGNSFPWDKRFFERSNRVNKKIQPNSLSEFNCLSEGTKLAPCPSWRQEKKKFWICFTWINDPAKATTKRLGGLLNPRCRPFFSNTGRQEKNIGKSHFKNLARVETSLTGALHRGINQGTCGSASSHSKLRVEPLKLSCF